MQVRTQSACRIPQDLSVIGIDNYALSDVLKLTTVKQDVVAQGRAAADTLLHTVLGPTEEPAPDLPAGMIDNVLTVPTELITRRTTSPVRGALV